MFPVVTAQDSNWFEEITVNVHFWKTEWSAEQLHCDETYLWCSIQLPLWPFLVCLHFSLWLCFCAISLILWKSIQLYWNDCKGLKYCQSFGVLTGAINKTNLFQKIIIIFFIIFQYDEVVRQHFESMCCAHLWFFLNRFNKMMHATFSIPPVTERILSRSLPLVLHSFQQLTKNL